MDPTVIQRLHFYISFFSLKHESAQKLENHSSIAYKKCKKYMDLINKNSESLEKSLS